MKRQISSPMTPCGGCNRHIKVLELCCPFCGTPTPMDRRASIGMAAAVVLGMAVAACSDDDDDGGGSGGMSPAYGVPAYGTPPEDSGTDAAGGAAGAAAAYAPVPFDSGTE